MDRSAAIASARALFVLGKGRQEDVERGDVGPHDVDIGRFVLPCDEPQAQQPPHARLWPGAPQDEFVKRRVTDPHFS